MEFSYFLYEINISLQIKYRKTNNRLINFFLKVVNWWQDCEFDQIKEYKQLLFEYSYWKSRQYYCQRIQKFVFNELSIADFIYKVFYSSLSNKEEAFDLIEDFQRQTNIDLNSKSFGFSKIISDLRPILEGFDENQEESFFTEKEFREIIENAAIKLEKNSIE